MPLIITQRKSRGSGWAAWIICAVLPICADAAETDRDSVVRYIMQGDGIPGLQAVVVKNGRVVWAKSYGYAVRDNPGPRIAMKNDSIVPTASVAKILVTVAVLQQVEKGKLALTDDINQYVPFVVRNPAWPNVPITWRMLLTHTSSMNTEDDAHSATLNVFGHDASGTLDDYIKSVFLPGGEYHWSERFTAYKPGTERTYSNTGFALAATALQGVIHEDFSRYVEREILKPLGMRDTGYWLAGRPMERYAVRYASLRQSGGTYRYVPAREYWAHLPPSKQVRDHQYTCPSYPEGCAYTTALDFARLMLMLMNRGTLDGKQILQGESVDAMTTPTGLRNHDGWAQGLGLTGPEDRRGRLVWGHAGDDWGAANAFYFNPKTGVGAIAFANGMDPEFTLSYAVVDLDLLLMSWFD